MWKEHFWSDINTSSYGASSGGRGQAPSLLWTRLFATGPISSTWDVELMAAESHTSNEKSLFLNRTVKKKGVFMPKL